MSFLWTLSAKSSVLIDHMDAFTLNLACQSDPILKLRYRGAVSCDEIPILRENDVIIINTTPTSDPQGLHWTAAALRRVCRPLFSAGPSAGSSALKPAESSYMIEFFCSYGTDVAHYKEIKKGLEKSCSHIVSNKRCLQVSWSSSCALFCLLFIWSQTRGIYLKEMLQQFFPVIYPPAKRYKYDVFAIKVITTLLQFPHRGASHLLLDLDFLMQQNTSV